MLGKIEGRGERRERILWKEVGREQWRGCSGSRREL